jgi:biopolymer transport protein ExbB
LRRGDYEAARTALERSPSAEAAVVVAGLLEADRGAKAAEEAMEGAMALQRMKLERRLAFLGTLGNNAPFIGLFGTVIGVVEAFEQLGKQSTVAAKTAAVAAPQEVMAAIAEALVATAVGLAVAIPAVAAYNYYQRLSKSVLANTSALSHVLLSYLVAPSEPVPALVKSDRGKAAKPAASDAGDEA